MKFVKQRNISNKKVNKLLYKLKSNLIKLSTTVYRISTII